MVEGWQKKKLGNRVSGWLTTTSVDNRWRGQGNGEELLEKGMI